MKFNERAAKLWHQDVTKLITEISSHKICQLLRPFATRKFVSHRSSG